MNKRLLAVAVAGAFALPGVALAQSSVTISGFLKGGYEAASLSNSSAARAGTNTSQHGVVDDSSRIIFNMREDLGGGLSAIGQVDMRVSIDQGGTGGLVGGGGNNHVGLQSKSWGRIFFGRQDLHYFNRESELTVRGSLRADSISILAFAGGGAAAIAGATRTPNVIHYTTPNWGGFTAVVAYSSTGATAVEGDIGVAHRKGRAWHLNPNFAGKNFQVGYSYWNSKPDGAVGVLDQEGHRLYGSYSWGGLKIGLAWDSSELDSTTPGVGKVSDRHAWSVPVQYTWGNHGIYGHYSVADDDDAAPFAGLESGARMIALSYAYNLSRRTSVALTYARIRNDAAAVYTPFTSTALGLPLGVLPGEDPRLWALTVRHAF
jgi:predicted porin